MPLRRLLRKVRRRVQAESPRPAILLYHRVVSLQHDPWALAVTPEHFEEHIGYIAKHRTPMFIDDMVERLETGTLPAGAIAVTFDDAYRDNLIHAKPILVRYGVPATVFVPTGYIGRTVPFWWDELSRMVLESSAPVSFSQSCGGDQIRVEWNQRESADNDLSWRGWEEPRTKRQKAYFDLWSHMQKVPEEERDRVMQNLRSVLGLVADDLAGPMNPLELEELTSGDHVRLGAHTVNHVSLSDLGVDEGQQEIQKSKVQCSSLTSRPVDGFAYPYGNMTPEACHQVEIAGFSWACSAKAGFLDQTTDRYRLPRIPIPDLSGRELPRFIAEA